MENKINVYSEIGALKKVLVHTPNKEIEYVTPSRLNELLFSAVLEPKSARSEHLEFVKILQDNGVEVVQLIDLVVETLNEVDENTKTQFIKQYLSEAIPKIEDNAFLIVYNYFLNLLKTPHQMVQKMMEGLLAKELNIKTQNELIIDPMPNLYFTRDPFASVGNGITLNTMYYPTRRRETIFAQFIFKHHKDYKTTPLYYDRYENDSIEGGDVFIYGKDKLVVGCSQRTSLKAIQKLAHNIQQNKEVKFKKIYVVNVPKKGELMHLDTWLTMLDYNKFLYSPNMMSVLKFWEIDLNTPDLNLKEINCSLQQFLESIINQPVSLIPVGGKNATQIEVDIETNFDATNYLVIRPGVVVGYSRNYKTELALKENGIQVIPLNGNQLSLGMGSCRCMSMPLYREDLDK
ncbi:MAG: arginine deiminase [Malacoplasma sp.]|nr:arginine deiminase [Malacoplasma sp.]